LDWVVTSVRWPMYHM